MTSVTRRPRVLIAEDHPGMAKSVSRLPALDCEVVGTVADGSAVLKAAQRLQPDVIVVDLNLPTVNGLEACRQITHVNPEAKVIVFTSIATLGTEKWSAGPTVVVLKQTGKMTYGALWNQVWSFSGNTQRADVNQMFLQPFFAYQARRTLTVTLQSETTANWEVDDDRWTSPQI